MRAAVDIMGGDRAPEEILKGCWQAAPLLDGDDLILLVGDEKIINTGLESLCTIADTAEEMKASIVHAMKHSISSQDIIKREEILSKDFSNRENAKKMIELFE